MRTALHGRTDLEPASAQIFRFALPDGTNLLARPSRWGPSCLLADERCIRNACNAARQRGLICGRGLADQPSAQTHDAQQSAAGADPLAGWRDFRVFRARSSQFFGPVRAKFSSSSGCAALARLAVACLTSTECLVGLVIRPSHTVSDPMSAFVTILRTQSALAS